VQNGAIFQRWDFKDFDTKPTPQISPGLSLHSNPRYYKNYM